MGVEVGFFMSPASLKILERKNHQLIRRLLTGCGNSVLPGSLVTVIDCQDSQVYEFRLVHHVGAEQASVVELPVDSTIGLALLGARTGDYIQLGVCENGGGVVILSVRNDR